MLFVTFGPGLNIKVATHRSSGTQDMILDRRGAFLLPCAFRFPTLAIFRFFESVGLSLIPLMPLTPLSLKRCRLLAGIDWM
jgi:hypothetical protein